MKAIRMNSYGGPEVLKLEDVARPLPGWGEVLIRVRAAGVNPADWKIRAGLMRDYMPIPMPFTLGFEAAGVVAAAGEGVRALKPGDEVFGAASGAYAEYAVAKESELAPKPATMDFATAAAVPVGALTAWQALINVGGLEAGQRVLILGGAGGVGSFAVQIAKVKGARVIATASGRNQSLLRTLGVDEPVDYESVNFGSVAKVDLVLDTVGAEAQQAAWQAVKRGGIMVSIVQPPSADEAAKHGARGVQFVRQPITGEMDEIAGLLADGMIKPLVETVLPLALVGQAHQMSQGGHTRGKIVLNVASA